MSAKALPANDEPWQTIPACGGTICLLKQFHSPQLERSNHIWVYVPAEYHLSAKNYPVLYMHDGQSVFAQNEEGSRNSLSVDRILEELVMEKKISGLIVVGIESFPAFRRRDLNPVKVSPSGPDPRIEDYACFIVNTLKPFIDARFKTLPQRECTGIAGFSAGAACSVYMGLKYQEVFSKIGAFSFTLSRAFSHASESMKACFAKRQPMKIYMDVGKMERQGLPAEIRDDFVEDFEAALKAFCGGLKDEGFDAEELNCVIDEQGVHSLADASKRIPKALLWLYGE